MPNEFNICNGTSGTIQQILKEKRKNGVNSFILVIRIRPFKQNRTRDLSEMYQCTLCYLFVNMLQLCLIKK